MIITYNRKSVWITLLLFFAVYIEAKSANGSIFGKVQNNDGQAIEFATIQVKGSSKGVVSDINGEYSLSLPSGKYTLIVSSLGYKPIERPISLEAENNLKVDFCLSVNTKYIEEVTITGNLINRINKSAFNSVAIDTKSLGSVSGSLGDALVKAPGLKLRESGGVGSDMQIMMDGFGGKHIKVFIDGVPQEGGGNTLNLNNLPVNFAERIEIYKGVVPVGFGTDAIGGVINIVTKKNFNKWFMDASYSYGSFNTHKSYINFGQTFKNGFIYEFNAFQNYSDNDYYIEASVKDFETGAINKKKIERLRRFHDKFHNEALIGKLGVTDKRWADRLMVSFTASNMYKEIQTGVRQDIVFGGKYRKGYSLIPSMEYIKRDLLKGLDLTVTANYNRNIVQNADTSSYEYNWRGESRIMSLPGEQTYQHTESVNNNGNATVTLNYRINQTQSMQFNHVSTMFNRSNQSLLNNNTKGDEIKKNTTKNISGFSYRYLPNEKWNLSVFGKLYNQYVSGPMATSAAQDNFVRVENRIGALGYGAAGTYFFTKDLQGKISYEKAYRLPTIDEMFGDEDLESGDVNLKPERSNNLNVNVNYTLTKGEHNIYIESGFVYRDTRDYIQRNVTSLSGGKYGATYINHGKVKTVGGNISVNYNYSKWLSAGGNFTIMNIRDNVKTTANGGNQASLTYDARIPNVPYQFANSYLSLYWNGLGGKANRLAFTYDNSYMHSFPLYSEALGSESSFIVPTQFSHNVIINYTLYDNKYSFALECQNFTNEKLYDNFSLQKAGRAFYGKVKVFFSSK